MSRFLGVAKLLTVLAVAVVPGAWAEDSPTLEEVRELRALIERQSKQLDALTEQVVKLRVELEKAGEVPFGGGAPAPIPAPIEPSAPAPASASAPPPAPAPAESSSEAPKAEAVDGKRHVVIKGETLTSIAKHYNMLLSDLKKANKDVDERKLQIGQTLIIPTPKSAEAPAKKDNP